MSKFISGTYIKSTSIKLQGNRNKISKYLRDGFKVQMESNGFWVLSKPAIVKMVFEEENKRYVFDMKTEACRYLGKIRISEKTAKAFIEAVKNEDIQIKICPEDGTYTVIYNNR